MQLEDGARVRIEVCWMEGKSLAVTRTDDMDFIAKFALKNRTSFVLLLTSSIQWRV